VPEEAGEVRPRVGQQRQGSPAGAQVGDDFDGRRVDRQPAAEVRRPQLVHARGVPVGADVAGDRPPVGGDARCALIEPVPVGEVRGPERLVIAVHPGEARDHRSVRRRWLQRDYLAVVEDHGPAGQRKRRASHRETVAVTPAGAAARPALRTAAPCPPPGVSAREPVPLGQRFEYSDQWYNLCLIDDPAP